MRESEMEKEGVSALIRNCRDYEFLLINSGMIFD